MQIRGNGEITRESNALCHMPMLNVPALPHSEHVRNQLTFS